MMSPCLRYGEIPVPGLQRRCVDAQAWLSDPEIARQARRPSAPALRTCSVRRPESREARGLPFPDEFLRRPRDTGRCGSSFSCIADQEPGIASGGGRGFQRYMASAGSGFQASRENSSTESLRRRTRRIDSPPEVIWGGHHIEEIGREFSRLARYPAREMASPGLNFGRRAGPRWLSRDPAPEDQAPGSAS